jgi:glycosyltransferase involved in cell wall biosynthesis
MKVAHILRKYNPAEWGGTETAMRQLCGGLRREGVDSVVFCPRIPRVAEGDPLAEAGCVVKRFKACIPIWGISDERRLQLVSVGGNLMSFDLIRALAREPDLSVIHAHATGRIGGIGRMIARRRGLPFLFTTHGGIYDLPDGLRRVLDDPAERGWEWGRLCGLILGSRRLMDGADAIITCNEREAALIRERHPGRLVVVQPHGVSAQAHQTDCRGAARAAFPPLQGREVLVAVGRIDAVKNQAWLVEQMPGLILRHPRLLLVLAGAPTDQGYAEALARRIHVLGLEERVLFTGGLPPGDPRLLGLIQEARAVVLPSVSESFGLVILEAWAAGTPVISTRTSGAGSLIVDGDTGLLFDLARPAEFHAGVDALWSAPGLAARLAHRGRERVAADFDPQALAHAMKRLYESLIERKRALRDPA